MGRESLITLRNISCLTWEPEASPPCHSRWELLWPLASPGQMRLSTRGTAPDFGHTRSISTAKLLSAFANQKRPRSRTLPKARHTFFVHWRGCEAAKPQRREQSCSCCLACCKWRTCFDGTVTAAAGPRANGSPSGSSKPCLIPQLVQASDGRLLLISLP